MEIHKVLQTEILEQPRGYGVNKSPPERLRYPKILEKLLKIVKSAEEASKKEEVCGYTCPSRNQGVRIFWKIA